MSDQPRDRRDAVRTWIADLYPPADGQPWGSLQPDRLTERFAGLRLHASPDLVDALIAIATQAQLEQLLTVYARAAEHPAAPSGLDRQLTELCVRHADVLTPVAITTSTYLETAGPLVEALRQRTAAETPLAELARMADHTPASSHNLAAWAADVAQLLVDGLLRQTTANAHDSLPQLATLLNNHAVREAALGRHRKAVAILESAIAVWRLVVTSQPKAWEPKLARALGNFSICLSEVGRHAEALQAIEEAVSTTRNLAANHSDAFLPDLARALNNQSNRQYELGQHQPALAAVQEAVTIYRRLAATRPDAFAAELAAALSNLTTCLTRLQRHAEALGPAEAALAIYQSLATDRPVVFLDALAAACCRLAVPLAMTGDRYGALTTIEEAIVIRRKLVARAPEQYQADLDSSLKLAALLRSAGP